ncbi:Cytosolic copper metallochaperone [Coemansia sp. IMI 209128]|nr:hypothetical protein GGI06_004202 [Coemansia sp. S85]KAJ2414150.1 hypothetical protein GGI10_002573 [Coemansia sp. RSA 2530]KAJ2701392.1 Cytosolic copper metallochaperone [Coemansia sp. IMI 209128]
MTGAISAIPQAPVANKDEAKKDEVKMNTYEFSVAMTCGGCSGAVTRALTNYNGGGHIVDIVATPVKNTVVLRSALPREEVLAVIAKTGKKVLGEPAEVPKPVVSEVAKQAPGPSPAA